MKNAKLLRAHRKLVARNRQPARKAPATQLATSVRRAQANPQQLKSADVLAMQRGLGNMATTRILSSSSGGPSVQRKLAFNPDFLKPYVSKSAKAKGFFGKSSTLSKIIKVLQDYKNTIAVDGELSYLRMLQALTDTWVKKHGQSKDRQRKEKGQLLFMLHSEVMGEIPKAQNQAEYLQDVAKPEGKFQYMSQSARQFAVPQAKALGTGAPGQPQTTLGLAKRYGLNDAEIAAVKIYTVDDYKYINPTLADSKGWLKSQIPKVLGAKSQDVSEQGLGTAAAEGKRHAKMAEAGLRKLPGYDKTTYRGMMLDKSFAKSQYLTKTDLPITHFFSTSKNQKMAQEFANGKDMSDDEKKGKVSIMMEIKLEDGKDVSEFSVVGGEDEVLVMPGSVLSVDSLESVGDNQWLMKLSQSK